MKRLESAPDVVRPDFFIVGAFKSGTTALYEYLRQHPDVFLPFLKEPHFFGEDLTHHYGRMNLDEYLALFRGARQGQQVGEASTWYLYSTSAAREIAEFTPDAKIIVLLRNPIDVMYAQHSQLRFRADETLTDFDRALEAESARRRGVGLPPPPVRPETLFYRRSVHFADQLERYFDVFGRERVHVALFDDLVADTPAVYHGVVEFLGIDSTFRPNFIAYNENKRVRYGAIQRLIYNPPGLLLGAIHHVRRYPLAHRLRDTVMRMNSRPQKRQSMVPALRAQLVAEFAPEIDRLSRMLDRDLSAWHA